MKPATSYGALPFLPLLLLLAAFGIRVYGLGSWSFWYDEGHSVVNAWPSFSTITDWLSRDIHPPLYFYLLHLWLGVFGDGEFTARYFSLAAGMLTLAILWKAGETMASRAAALWALLLATLSPLLLAYAQEARMYAFTALWAILSAYLLHRAIRRDGYLSWAAFGAVAALGLYTHYYFALVLAGEALALGLWALSRPRQRLLKALTRGGAVVVGIALVYYPWAGIASRQLATWRNSLQPPPQPSHLAEQIALAFTLGPSADSSWPPLVYAIPPVVLALALLLAVKDKGRRFSLALLAACLGATLVGITLGANSRAVFHPRYLVQGAPFYYLLAGYVIASLWRRRWAVAAPALLALCVAGLLGIFIYYQRPVDDARSVARYLKEKTTDRDVILIDTDHPFLYYLDGQTGLYFLNWGSPIDQDLIAKIRETTQDKERAYFVRWRGSAYDPKQLVSYLLGTYGSREEELAFPGYWLDIYRLPESPIPAEMPKMVRADFVSQAPIKLTGFTYGDYDGHRLSAEPGRPLPVALRWLKVDQNSPDPIGDLAVAVALENARGGGIARIERPLVSSTILNASRWQVGEEHVNYYLLPVPLGARPGQYSLKVGLYELPTMRYLPLDNGQLAAIVGQVTVGKTIGPVPADKLPVDNLVAPDLSGVAWDAQAEVALLGYQLPSQTVRAGDQVRARMCWQAKTPPQKDYLVTLGVGDRLSAPRLIGGQDYPISKWVSGEIVCEEEGITVPSKIEPGKQRVWGQLLQGDKVSATFELGNIKVIPIERLFKEPSIPQRTTARFGSGIELLGYALTSGKAVAGGQVDLVIYWKAITEMETSYTVFVHLLGADNKVYGQVDQLPLASLRPTTSWLAGEIVEDRYSIPVDPKAPAGLYAIELGLYNAENMERLPLESSAKGGQRSQDGLILTEIEIVGRSGK